MQLSTIYKSTNSPIHLCNRADEFDAAFLLQIGKGHQKKILVVGESPALHGRIESNRAFYTVKGNLVPSGKIFNRLFEPYNIQIEKTSFTELCKCVVGKERKLLKECGQYRWNHFLIQIEFLQPRLIILLGKQTTEIFSKLSNIDLTMGEKKQGEINSYKTLILPIFHPSPINPHSFKKNKEILEKNSSILTKIR